MPYTDEERREAHRHALAKYYASPKGKANKARKSHSPAAKAAQARYHATAHYRELTRRPEALAYQRAYKARLRAMRPEVLQARAALNGAVRQGTLSRPAACEDCGQVKRVEGHHHLGWEPQHWLNVRWLCTPCHRIYH